MANDNKFKSDSKKGMPGGFFVFLLAMILLILTVQNLSGEKSGKVSFSHQAEHLVNLDLIQQDQSRKVALNDNLVTFSGKFKDQLSEDAKARYRFLELLQAQHQLNADKTRLASELSQLQKNVMASAQLFLELSGLSLPKEGFVVVDPVYDTPDRVNSIVITQVPKRSTPSLRELQVSASRLSGSSSDEDVASLGKDVLSLVQGYRSPILGIGIESMKNDLKSLEQEVGKANNATVSAAERLAVYKDALAKLQTITNELMQNKQNVRLMGLRSVRNYKVDLEQYNYVVDQLDKNTVLLDKARQSVADVIWFFNNEELSTRALEKQNPELFNHWFAGASAEYKNFSVNRSTFFKAPDQPRNKVLEKTFKSEEPAPNYISYFFTLLPVLLLVFLLYFVFSRQMKGVGSGAMNFGKSPAKLMTKEQNKVTFKDVAGCDEAKEELQEIVDFLREPSKFTALGARIPKGVLCIGAPGTGKTLIARAVAGEANRPFFTISGSDFVEMFVGVGASRIRDMFDQAKKNAPCIIFMDEIDAVGRRRGEGIGGGHDEREQTLNQLLVEMDGFDTSEGVILIAATNRPDVLDKALLRPGRFDRRIVIDLPDVKGRYEILKVHARRIKLDSSVDLMNIAKNTPGASGADLANILNEAALIAARKGRSAVTASDAYEATDKVRYGKERKSLELDKNEKRTTAFHESGHAIAALFVEHSDPVDKVTIIPRGLSLGATHFMPEKNRVNYWKKEILDQLIVLMGGRVAEEIFVGDISSGAQMDINQATKLARAMVCEWGMTDSLGLVAYDERQEGGQYLGMQNYNSKNYSEDTARSIDSEIKKHLDIAYKKAHEILEAHRDQVQLMTDMLMEFESLDREDVLAIKNNTWDIEKKRQKLKSQEEAHRKNPQPPKTVISPEIGGSPTPQSI